MPKKVLRDEQGRRVWRGAPVFDRQMYHSEMTAEEAVECERYKGPLIEWGYTAKTGRKGPLDEFDIGAVCLRAEESGIFCRRWAYGRWSLARIAQHVSGEGTRQTWDRRMLVALVYSRETVAACQAANVGFGVLAMLAAVHYRVRTVLVDLARAGASTRALTHLRQLAERRVASWDEVDPAPILYQAYDRWKAKRVAAREDRGRTLAELQAERARLSAWEQRLQEWEQRLQAGRSGEAGAQA